MTTPPIGWVTEAEVVGALDLQEALNAIETALPSQLDGSALTMEKTHISWPGGHTLHAVGGAWLERSLVGVKAWAHAGGAAPLLLLWDADDGHCVAILEAFGLGQLRTAAMSAVATKWLARPEAHVLAVIGSGRQAASQVAAAVAVRPIEQVRVFSPTAAHREDFARRLSSTLQAEVITCTSVEDAVGPADLVTTITRATTPFLQGKDLKRGTHINGVGAITPERAELDRSVVERCDVIVTDSAAAAKGLAAELAGIEYMEELGAVIRHGGPSVADDLSLFKPMGLGLADVILGAAVLQRLPAGGRTIPSPKRTEPRLARTAMTP